MKKHPERMFYTFMIALALVAFIAIGLAGCIPTSEGVREYVVTMVDGEKISVCAESYSTNTNITSFYMRNPNGTSKVVFSLSAYNVKYIALKSNSDYCLEK